MAKKKSPRRYAGLTDDLPERKEQHGNPPGFRVARRFRTERQGRKWEEGMLNKGYKGDTGGKGWKFGYTFPVGKKKK